MRHSAAMVLRCAIGLVVLAAARPGNAEPTPLPADHPAARAVAEKLNALPPVPAARGVRIDHSGRKETGRASFYAHHFTNRKMADGRRMNPNANIAASKQLPLGSVAKVTNLSNGRTATVKVEDRGPYVAGRVVDVAPKVAQQLGMQQKGVTRVEVAPITVPNQDGSVKLGAGAAQASDQEVKDAVRSTEALRGQTPEPQPAAEASR